MEDDGFGLGFGPADNLDQDNQDQQDQQQAPQDQAPAGNAGIFLSQEQFQLLLAAARAPQAAPERQQLPDDDPSHWKNIKPNDIPLHKGKKDDTRSAAWLKNLMEYAKVRGLPQSQWTRLAVMRLTGESATWFEGYIDPSTNIVGDRDLDWDTFRRAYLRATIDVMNGEQLQDAWDGDRLRQHTSVERYVEVWNEWLRNYRCCEELKDMYSEKMILEKFKRGLKGPVAAMVKTNKDVKTFDDAVEAAKKIDPVLFKETKNSGGGRGGSSGGGASGASHNGGRLPSFTFHNRDSRSREGTPGPPGTPASVHSLSERDQAILNALNALSSQFSGRGFQSRSGGATPRSGGSGPYNMNNLPPKMTPATREWCDRNRACYRCRQPNADHMSRQCPHFQGSQVNAVDNKEPNQDPFVNAIADLIDFSEPQQGNGQ
mmetsp:Transcript_59702/g.122484  ORF Transcript_59702/g.122484 Transcript_59702/m.122484 type:complete len:430 (+) Transcript_59702:384-1673(+)